MAAGSTAVDVSRGAANFAIVKISKLEESKTNPRRVFAKDALSDLTGRER